MEKEIEEYMQVIQIFYDALGQEYQTLCYNSQFKYVSPIMVIELTFKTRMNELTFNEKTLLLQCSRIANEMERLIKTIAIKNILN